MELPEIIQDAAKSFSQLNGVGEKTAVRQIFQMTKWTNETILEMSESIQALTRLKYCQSCGFFSEEDKCHICSNDERVQSGQICVVEKITDCIAIENSSAFRGVYHILGGVLNPLLGIGPRELRLENLKERIVMESYEEVIIAINPSVEGDATSSYIKSMLPDKVKVDRIGFGIPIGGSLEYLDSVTISKALENKKLMS